MSATKVVGECVVEQVQPTEALEPPTGCKPDVLAVAVEHHAEPVLLYVAGDGHTADGARERKVEGSLGVHRDQVVLVREGHLSVAGKVHRHRGDLHHLAPLRL